MPVTHDILRSYRAPGEVFSDRLAEGQREDRVFINYIVASLLIFAAFAPWVARRAHFDPDTSLEAELYWLGLFWVLIMPFVYYVLAAVTRLVAGVLGGQGTFHGARVALALALLAAAPLFLLVGLTAGLVGPGPALNLTQAAAFGGFFAFWGLFLWRNERGRAA